MDKAASVVVVDSNARRANGVASLFDKETGRVDRFESLGELRTFWPSSGMVVMHDDDDAVRTAFSLMVEQGSWLPVLVYASDPRPARIVEVISAGAMDYLEWPMSESYLAERLRLLPGMRPGYSEVCRAATHCQRLVAKLTHRQREVLFRLPDGASNKSIARDLQISPRTIEIHRAKMMSKLGATTVGQAISIALYSRMASSVDFERDHRLIFPV